jgi:hypothetical protein
MDTERFSFEELHNYLQALDRINGWTLGAFKQKAEKFHRVNNG